MKALVTGASGFTGFHLAKTLKERGVEVYGFVRSKSRLSDLEKGGIQPVYGDLTNAESVEKAVQGMDVVYHIAASYRESGASVERLHDINVNGTRHVMDAVLKAKVKRVVHCSTVGVHGHVDQPPANEDAPFKPGDEYQDTKLEGEILVQKYIDSKGLPATIFRPVGIYGPGDKRFLKLFKAIRKGTFVMFGTGDVLYHLTYIDDLVNGIIMCGEKDEALGKTYIIAGEKATTLNELTGTIADVLGVKPPRIRIPYWMLWWASCVCEDICKFFKLNPPLFRRRAHFFIKDRAFDISRIQNDLHYVPQIPLLDGIKRTAEWYREKNLI